MSKLVDGDRQRDYGDPSIFFRKVAVMWSVILGIDVTPEKAVLLMIAFKLVRQANKHKDDNLDDLDGYTEILRRLTKSFPQD